MRWQGESGRKVTGGKLILSRGKRKYETGRESADTTLAATRKKTIETLGGNSKTRLLRADTAIVTDLSTGKSSKAKIQTVVGNGANLNYIRRNIITKGAVIRTELGDARVTNRPGQDGAINAVLMPQAQ
jgi:small subunit ribosomal protein S8e